MYTAWRPLWRWVYCTTTRASPLAGTETAKRASARPGGPGREGNGAPPMSKAEALANLEKLFKK